MDIARPPQSRNRRRLLVAGAVLALGVGVTLGLDTLRPAAPDVDRAAVLVAAAKRGPLVIEVRGPGTLVPEEIRWITAVTAGRVERRLLEPGAAVKADSIILELANPDVELEALQARCQLTAARAALLRLRTELESERLGQVSAVATARAELGEAQRQAAISEDLVRRKIISRFEAARRIDRDEEVRTRHHVAVARLRLVSDTLEAKVSLQQEQVERLREVHAFHRDRIASMQVRAGTDGVLQETPLEVGQWAQPGATLAVVVEPDRLKAVLKIPETLARDIAPGQDAAIDTRNGVVGGKVVRVDPSVLKGTVAVHVALVLPLPRGA